MVETRVGFSGFFSMVPLLISLVPPSTELMENIWHCLFDQLVWLSVWPDAFNFMSTMSLSKRFLKLPAKK